MALNHYTRMPLAMIAALSLMVVGGHAWAANAQQQKMTACNADAKTKNLQGDDRKAFMKSCLSTAPAATSSMNSQQEKMKSCNAEAKTKALKGDERKAFMKTCLSGS
jgi:hypothetical protein